MKIDESNILTIRLTLPQIADELRRSTSWLRDIRNRDRRFPDSDAAGRYSLAAVLCLLDIRDNECMTDEEFDQDRRAQARELLAQIEKNGDTWEPIRKLAEEIIAGRHDGQRQEWIDQGLEDLQRFSDV